MLGPLSRDYGVNNIPCRPILNTKSRSLAIYRRLEWTVETLVRINIFIECSHTARLYFPASCKPTEVT